jgi:hypothetical protein
MSLASQKLIVQLIFTGAFALLALLVTWLILGDGSPFHDYFLWHVDIPNLWGMTTFVPFLLSAGITGNPHSPSMAIFLFALIVQWLLIGYFVSIPLSRLFMRARQNHAQRSRSTS